MSTYTAVLLRRYTKRSDPRIFEKNRSNDVERRDHSVQHRDFLRGSQRVQHRHQRVQRQHEHLHDAQHPVGGSRVRHGRHGREEKHYASLPTTNRTSRHLHGTHEAHDPAQHLLVHVKPSDRARCGQPDGEKRVVGALNESLDRYITNPIHSNRKAARKSASACL